MRYLIQNRKEFAITVGVFVTSAVNLVRGIRHGIISEESIAAFVVALFALLGWYFNMPTSKENCEATGEMRLKKAQNNGQIDGENFVEERNGVDD